MDEASAADIESISQDAKVISNRLKELWKGNDYDFFWVARENASDYEAIADIYAPVVYFEASRFKNAANTTIEMLVLYLMSHGQEMSNFTGRETRMIVDEAHKVFREVEQAGRIEEFVLSGRNDGQNFTFISQSDQHFNAESAQIISNQCRTSYWYSLGNGLSTEAAEAFGWSPAQADLFDTLVRADDDGSNYAECLVDIDGETYLIERRMDPYNFRLLEYREHEHAADFAEYMRPFDSQPAPNTLSAGPVVDDYHATLTGPRGHGGTPEAVADGGEDQ